MPTKGQPRKMKSKRMTCKLKYKIASKVKEHNRKTKRKEKKKGPQRPKKDLGIPNLAPFKEAILREAEDRKYKAEEMRKKQKEVRHKEFLKNRKLSHLQKDAERRQKLFEKKSEGGKTKEGGAAAQDVESSRKAYYKEFKKVLEASDVVIEVLDARDPIGSRCIALEKAVLASGTNKKLVLLLNKVDLVPREITEKWLKHLRNEFPAVAFKATTQTQRSNLSQSKVPVSMSSSELLQTSHCLGADSLIKLLSNYCRNVDIKTSITVGIVGFPNVGKSSIINSLKRNKVCTVGAMPGVTKAKQEVQLAKNIKLLDCPGVVMATGNSESAMVLRNCVKLETISDPMAPVDAILKRCTKQSLMLHYNIPNFSNVDDFLSLLARRYGKLKKGGLVDVEGAAKIILQDWNTGKITYYTHPPEQHSLPSHIDASIVTQLGQEFNVASLEKEDEKILKGLRHEPTARGMEIETIGQLEGIVDDEALEAEEEGEEEDEMDEEEEEEEDDEEEESDEMGDDNEEEEEEELNEVTVKVPESKAKAAKSKREKVEKLKKGKPSKVDSNSPIGNQQLNKASKLAFKKILKKRKKSDKLATVLSDELTQAFDFFQSGRGDSDDDGDDNYSFKKDFFR
ncbi:guanine nucleotide-binding protein-like NSN1 isoform X1 [Strongylocentrotus purpuratus]|uniref:CP-type G domain-containing protein n=1 Tax=Strongylocentrotus purpuratus TaxID=7668 RepID=A0A7M7MY94_STRPU|nr:guanine nucleotide-binding protein-like NSN1 isoform X1 [Strongylocentrotus purpuratus]